jgi:hypothetical protein
MEQGNGVVPVHPHQSSCIEVGISNKKKRRGEHTLSVVVLIVNGQGHSVDGVIVIVVDVVVVVGGGMSKM